MVCNHDGQIGGICNSGKEGMSLLGGVSGVEPPHRNCPTQTFPAKTRFCYILDDGIQVLVSSDT
ncbi:hypothetical protein [Lunatibacter salilacus]|uniref:hypothetical protein n=1 Tax=Lunatibacter salilacus TaxID=2483804 RepID=UPI00131E3CC6|nr:hypothetical protein [Lunatibacter salilacus]